MAATTNSPQQRLRHTSHKPRVFIVSDISNEPDDAESLVRYLLYSNEFRTRGLVACTSTWMRTAVHPEDMVSIIQAYGRVVSNLNAHVHPDDGYAAAEEFLGMVREGPRCYGLEAMKEELSEGARLLVERVDESDEVLWVLAWGGINTLAQALASVQKSRSEAEFKRFREKLRVYTISDQDDTGVWIRVHFPDIFYVCSLHGWNEYGRATWVAISGEGLVGFDKGGPDGTIVSKEWLRENIQLEKSPLGKVYPTPAFIMEGDTPTFLYLIRNGLGDPEHPEWGSWGGRYTLVDLGGTTRHFSDAADEVVGKDGRKYRSNHATIWRWRDHYQNSFAARMQWTLTDDFAKANHAPVIQVVAKNGDNNATTTSDSAAAAADAPLLLSASPSSTLTLDASSTYDPDPTDTLTFKWYQYKEPTTVHTSVHWIVPDIPITPVSNNNNRIVALTLPAPEICAANMVTGQALREGMQLHFVLEVSDSGTPCLTSYKRIVVQIVNDEMKGGREKGFETVTAALGKD